MFTDVFIRRPVFASAINLLLFVGGLVSFFVLPVRQFPLIETNVVTVTTNYPGASAELMAGFVSTPLENAIGSVEGIDYMTSTNQQGSSAISIYLKLNYPIESGLVDTMNEVSSVIWTLPKQIQDPIITKQDPNASPTVYISFSSNTISESAVTDFLLRVIQPQLATLDGVSQAAILGERKYAMRLNLDPFKMTAFNVSANDVNLALQTQNLQGATGTIEGIFQNFNVVANTDLETVHQFEEMIIRKEGDYLVRIKDIGEVVLGSQNYNSSAVVNGRNTTVIGIIPTTDANPLAVSKEVEKLMPSIQKQLPGDIKGEIVYDSSIFIEASINEVYNTMFEAAFFVLIVIFLFLGNLRAIFIPLITIPLSLIGVSAIMIALNYTINTISLLAWVLAIGLVVDDAIVVLENIYRHMEEGLAAIPAAIIGAREIGFAVIAMTITLAAVYAPIGFTGGLTGILFSEFAFTLASAVIISGFVALTLSPMMCSKLLKYDSKRKGFSHVVDKIFNKVTHVYKKALTRTIAFRWFIMIGALGIYVLFFYLFLTTESELAPTEDQGVVQLYATGPTAANIKFTEKYMAEVNPIFDSVPEKQSYAVVSGYPSGVNSAIGFLNLVNWNERQRTAMQINAAIFPQLWSIPGMSIVPVNPPPLPLPGTPMPIQFVLKNIDSSTKGLLYLNNAVLQLIQAAEKHGGFMGMYQDLKVTMPQVFVEIDRNKAGDLGISIEEISSALNIMLGQPEQVQFTMEGRGYYVIPEFTQNFNFNANPDDINDIYVHASNGDLVPLSNVVTLREQVVPQTINHFQQLNSTTLYANNSPTFPLGSAMKFLEDYAQTNFPDLQIDYAGQSRQYIENSGAMTQVLIFAIIIIFLVLAAQFESYRDPIIVLGVVPLTLAGAVLTLRLTGGTLNLYSEIGLTTLVGLIAKHGILIVEFANQLQLKGYSKIEAVIESASMRLRPILMTTGAMVLGALPLALATGAGSVSRNQIGAVIVGGMLIGTLFSLFVVPCVYTLIAKVKQPDEKLEQEIQAAILKNQPSK